MTGKMDRNYSETSCDLVTQGVSKMTGQTSRRSYSYPNKEEEEYIYIYINICPERVFYLLWVKFKNYD